MGRRIKKIRKSFITKEEFIADVIFASVSMFASALIIFLFDIHHSFYSWPMKIDFIFKTPGPYFVFIPIGTIIGFFLIKIILFGFKEEERLE
jgi:lysylphosphatidylglycerol synthetase-like protein (DUF2156 family)